MVKGLRYFNMGPWPVYVGFTTSEKAFAAEMKRLKVKDEVKYLSDDAVAQMHTFECDGSLCCIITAPPFNPRKFSREQYAATVAHEAVHVLQGAKDHLSKGDPFGDEAESYFVQHIVQECLQVA